MKTNEEIMTEYNNIQSIQVWQPSVRLRNVERVTKEKSKIVIETKLVLQQLFTSNLGNREWRDVPTEIE